MFHSEENFGFLYIFHFLWQLLWKWMFWAGKSQNVLMKIFSLFQNLIAYFSKGNLSSWGIFLNEMRHDFSELFHFLVTCSPGSRKYEKKLISIAKESILKFNLFAPALNALWTIDMYQLKGCLCWDFSFSKKHPKVPQISGWHWGHPYQDGAWAEVEA